MAKEEESPDSTDGALVSAAKAIGATAGKMVAAVGLGAPPPLKVPKLVKKVKARSPRRKKKAMARKAAKSA